MAFAKQRLAAVSLIASVSVAGADSLTYHNDQFEVHGALPMGFVAKDAPEHADGRVVFNPQNSARITVYGGYNHLESFAAYRAEYKGYYLDRGADVTYATGKEDWFVLSGYDEGLVFYVRVQQGKTCVGETVLGHWMITYDPADRASCDRELGPLSKELEVGSC